MALKSRKAGRLLAQFIAVSVPSLKILEFVESATLQTLWGFVDAITSSGLKLEDLNHIRINDFACGRGKHVVMPVEEQLMGELRRGCPKLKDITDDYFSDDGRS